MQVERVTGNLIRFFYSARLLADKTKLIVAILIFLAVCSWITFGVSLQFLGDDTLKENPRKNWETVRNIGLIFAICTSAGAGVLIKYG